MQQSSNRRLRRKAHVAAAAAAVCASAVATGASLAATPTHWLAPTSGQWKDGSKWSSAPNYPVSGAVVIDAAGSAYTISTINDPILTLDSLVLNSPDARLLHSSGMLTVNGTFGILAGSYRQDFGVLRNARVETAAGARFELTGGNIQNVTIAGAAIVSGSQSGVSVVDGLTLDNANVSLAGAAAGMYFDGQATLGGTGTITFDNPSGIGTLANVIAPIAMGSNALTIGSGVTIRNGTTNGTVGALGYAVVNHGTITATNAKSLTFTGTGWSNTGTIESIDGTLILAGSGGSNTGTIRVSGGTLTISATNWTNAGIVRAGPGTSLLNVTGSGWTNAGVFDPAGGISTVSSQNWVNTGTIRASAGTLDLGGSTTAANLGTLEETGTGRLIVSAAIDLQGTNFDVTALGGGWFTGTLKNGTVVSAAGAPLAGGGRRFTLDNVTLATDIDNAPEQTSNGPITYMNGLTLSGTQVRFRVGSGLAGTGTQTVGGSGEIIVDDHPGSFGLEATIGGDGTTFGPGITIRTGVGTDPGNSSNTVRIRLAENQGAIRADTASLPVVIGPPVWTNSGSIGVSAGSLTLLGNWTNAVGGGSVTATGGKLVLGGAWTNHGDITASNTTVQLAGSSPAIGNVTLTNCPIEIAGSYSTAQLNQIVSSNPVSLAVLPDGALNNTGTTLALSPATTGHLHLSGGSITGGTITAAGGAKVLARYGTLDGVTLAAPMEYVPNTASSTVTANAIANQSSITFNGGELLLKGSWSNAGTIAVSNGGTLHLASAPASFGNVAVENADVRIAGSTTTAQLQSIATSGNIAFRLVTGGTIDNTGATITVSAPSRLWVLHGGKVIGGVFASAPTPATTGPTTTIGLHMGVQGSMGGCVLDGVTLATHALVTGGTDIAPRVRNGLTLQGGAVLTLGTTTTTPSGHIVFEGAQTLAGAGEVVFEGSSTTMTATGGALTIGPDVTVRSGANGGTLGLHAFSGGSPIVNEGLVSAQTNARTLTLAGTLTNHGTFEARNGGTLRVSPGTTITNLTAGTLTDGTWRAVGGTLTFPTGTQITTNAASVVLSGATSSFPAINAMTANSGTFELAGGRNFLASSINNSGTMKVGAASTFTAAGALTWSGGAIDGAGVLRAPSALITGDVVRSGGGVSRFEALSIAAGKRLDLTNGKLITREPIGAAGAGGAYDGVHGLVQSAYNFSAWDGPGIMTSMPDAQADRGITTLAVATADQTFYAGGTFGGVSVSSGDVLVMYTYAGDLNLDGLIDGADYGVIDNYVQFPGTSGYANGDINYDGAIDGADYGVIDNTIQLQGEPFPSGTFGAAIDAAGVTAVPEAGCGAAVVVAALIGAARRRRRRRWQWRWS